jgi:hypothetical protein
MSAADHRRHLNLALAGGIAALAAVWLARVPGVAVGLAYLGPAVFVFLLLWLGHYPGERLLVTLSRPTRRRRRTPAFMVARRALAHLPRGGSLLACALAGRAPPLSTEF